MACRHLRLLLRAGLRQLRHGGRLSYISSNSWLRANYAGPLRTFLRKQTTVEQLIDLGDNRVFADAPDVYPAIHVVRRDLPPSDHTAQAAVFTRGEGLANFEEEWRPNSSRFLSTTSSTPVGSWATPPGAGSSPSSWPGVGHSVRSWKVRCTRVS